LVKKHAWSDLDRQSVKRLSDREICERLEALQPNPEMPLQSPQDTTQLKTLRAELLRRTYLLIEQQKREYQEYKMTLAA
jgi:hypothetical protein